MRNDRLVDEFNRVEWNSLFMSMAVLVSQRSIDKDTKHGTIVTDKDHTLLSMGYNGPPRKCIDSEIPLTRPDKYYWIVHSESAAIINAARIGVCLKNSIFYITGIPCPKCLGEIISVGASKIYCGCVSSNSVDMDEKVLSHIKKMITISGIELYLLDMDISIVFEKTLEYFSEKYHFFQKERTNDLRDIMSIFSPKGTYEN